MIVTSLGELVDGVYDVVQTPDASGQDTISKTPPTLPSLQVTVPVGMFCEFDVSVTVAVNVSVCPDTYDAGFGDTATDTGESRLDVKTNVPEFIECMLSPL